MEFKKRTELFILSAFVTLAILYIAALSQDLFFYIWWFDIPLHFLGGLWIGLTSIYIYHHSERFKPIVLENHLFLSIFLCVIVVGVLWEFFEYYTGLAFAFGNYPLDTVKDMLMDILGGVVSYIYFRDNLKELSHE